MENNMSRNKKRKVVKEKDPIYTYPMLVNSYERNINIDYVLGKKAYIKV